MEIEIGDGPLTFILILNSLRVGGWLELDYNVSSGPFLSFDIGDGLGAKLDNFDDVMGFVAELV